MAKLNKDQEETKTSPYDFILPLQPHQLKAMWDEYTDGKAIKNYRAKNGRLVPAEYVFYNREKVLSYDSELGSWATYVPDGMTAQDFDYKYVKAKRHWKQFEEYARKREYAIKQDTNQPILNIGDETEVKMLDFWQP